MPLRLTSATLTFLVLPLALAVAVLGAFALQAVERQVEARMREDIELIARAIEGPVAQALRRGQQGAVQETLESTFAFGRVYGAHVFDDDGNLIAGAGAGADAMPIGELDRIGDTEAREGRYTRFSGEPLFSYFVPISDQGGRFTALLQVSRHTGGFRADLARLNRIGIIALAVLVAALSGIVLFGHRHAIGRPLAHLTATMTRIAGGEPGRRAEPEGPRELRELTHTFNATMDRLQESGAEIERRRDREASLERRLEHSRRLAAVGELAAGIAHELGTPLSVIDGRAQRLRRRRREDPALVRDVDALRDEVARIGHLVRELQDFARRNPLRSNTLAAEQVVRSTLERLEPVLQRHDVQPEIDLPEPDLPLLADLHRLQQALGNLVRNAAQAAVAAAPRIRIGAFPDESGVRFLVEDNGPGLTPAVQDRVFEPFFTTKAVGEGMGLGLAVVHRVAEDHGGRVRVSRGELGGARFELMVPARPDTENDADDL